MHTLQSCLDQEIQRFEQTHAKSMALSQASSAHFLYGAPLHWMSDWSTPHLIHIAQGHDAVLVDVDGHAYIDLCLGDTGAMFGHQPAAWRALTDAAQTPFTTMLPSAQLADVGEALAERFGLPYWQVTLSASDANRFLLRWARAITQRPMILVFDGCYHGAVDDTLVDWSPEEGVQSRASLLGEAYSHCSCTRVVPFNDLDALAAALAQGDVACVLAEPALTNCGLVLPDEGFWAAAQQLCRQHGSLLILDETHTLSSGLGGYAQQHGLQPDAIVMGKAIAGGWPCGVYGFTANMAQAMLQAKAAAPAGHSGIGTTLSGNAMTLVALHAALNTLHQPASYTAMQSQSDALAQGLRQLLAQHQRAWTVSQLGARMELQCCAQLPRNAVEARAAQHADLERFLHLFMLNRGVLLTPFHNMILCAPSLRSTQVARVLQLFDAWLHQVTQIDTQ